jgi:hypothetical protein
LTWRKAKTETVWPFSAEVTALADSQPVRQKTWTLCGKVRKSFDIVPERVSFLEENLIQGQSFPSLTVEVSPQTELTGLAAECRPPLGRVVVAPSKKKLTFSVTVTPKQDLAVGNFEFDVVLRGHTKGTVLPPVPLRVIGKVLQEVEVIPPAVLFGHGVLGEQSEEILMLRSRIGKKLRVLSFQSSSESTKIGPLKESPDSSPQFRIQQSFLMTGQQSATITFFALIDDRRITLAVPVRYFGLSKTTEDGKGLQ